MKATNLTSRCPSATVAIAPQFCRELIDALGKSKARLVAQYEQTLPGRSQLIRQAVAEAEEMAWHTPFPHLFLPDFAEVRLAEIFGTLQPAYARAA